MAYAIVVVIVLILDQAMKYWTNMTLALGETKALIPGLVEFLYTHNDGAAFGIFGGSAAARWLFIALMFLFCAVVIYVLSNDVIKDRVGRWSLALIMAGGLGNCIDRLVNGYVIDMFHFTFKVFGKDFPVFNVADMFLSVCGIIFCMWIIFHQREETEKPEPNRYPPNARTTRKNPQPQQGADYITQLKKPVAAARAELETPPAEPQQKTRAKVSPTPISSGDEPFTQFFANSGTPAPSGFDSPRPTTPEKPSDDSPRMADASSSATASRRGGASPTADTNTAPRQDGVSPTTNAKPTTPSAPKKSDTDFTLDDILAEFSSK